MHNAYLHILNFHDREELGKGGEKGKKKVETRALILLVSFRRL